MPRRRSRNVTGIPRLEGVPYHDAWIAYVCIRCGQLNTERIGQELTTPEEAFDKCIWKRQHCGFIHAKESDLPFSSWRADLKEGESETADGFWRGFFRSITEHRESYWKQCNACGRILPFSHFNKHSGWGPLERQMECRACKGAINAELNPKRTVQQMYEASITRRIADVFLEGDNEAIDIDGLFDRFNHECFKTKKHLDKEDRSSWAIDHILPSKYLYPLTRENAALLSREANESKKAMWPSSFYSNDELIELARITGADIELLSRDEPVVNRNVDVNNGVDRYLQIREQSDLNKRILELRNILLRYELVDMLSEENRQLLGLSQKQEP